jgi:RNA polymerase sigma-70 factor (ECF subfamily)
MLDPRSDVAKAVEMTHDYAALPSDSGSEDFTYSLAAAHRGNLLALGKVFEASRTYLHSIAYQDLPPSLHGKCDPADLVQETLLEAHRSFERCESRDENEFRCWLRAILVHTFADWNRRYRRTYKRSVARERSLSACDEISQMAFEASDPSPTPVAFAIDCEKNADLIEALERLSAADQAVIDLRSGQSLSFKEIGRRLNCSSDAARKLWSRAIARLRSLVRSRWATDY